MQNVAIFPVVNDSGESTFRAVASTGQSVGRTAGEALDALAPSLSSDNSGTVVVIQAFRPDTFFTAQQQSRLKSLMLKWQAARDTGGALSSAEQQELDQLIQAELTAATERAGEMLRGLGK